MTDSREEQFPPLAQVPVHVGIIMDGNGRWARERGRPRSYGHRAGVENIRRVLEASVRFGIRILTLYAFSTENWNRPQAEVNVLLNLLSQALRQEVPELHANGVRLNHIGRLERIPPRLRRGVLDAIELTKDNDRLLLNVAFNYGGRAEVVDAAKRIIQAGIAPDDLTEDVFERYLYTAGQPDPDLIIRTAGELRISNFLLWQGAYAEYYAAPVYWPDFDEGELYRALQEYNRRQRRYGRLPGDA
ncbi:MAG: isoprenyl transferase [Anaerolineae bacterium]|nr:isoprenyl transferase [Anaerolineae bacterium]